MKELRVLKSEQTVDAVRVFVAEDNAADVFWLEMVFKSSRLPYVIELAVDAATAKNHIQQFQKEPNIPPDMVLLDVNLPGPDISELLDCLPRSLSVPLFMISGAEVPRHLRDRVGEERCLQKPMTHLQLFECLDSAGILTKFGNSYRNALQHPGSESSEATDRRSRCTVAQNILTQAGVPCVALHRE